MGNGSNIWSNPGKVKHTKYTVMPRLLHFHMEIEKGGEIRSNSEKSKGREEQDETKEEEETQLHPSVSRPAWMQEFEVKQTHQSTL